MKKIFFILCIVATASTSLFAQCTPDTTHFSGTKHVYPDSLPCIVNGTSFSDVVSIQIPDSLDAHDFFNTIPAGTAKIYLDSVRIETISGYPTGISSVSNPPLNSWIQPNRFACATFSGTSTAAAGRYNLTITGSGCAHGTFPVIGYKDSCITGFSFNNVFPYHLQVCYPAGISDIETGLALSIYPNPNQGVFTVTISTPERIIGEMTVIDALGRKIHAAGIDVTGRRQIPLDLHSAAPGVYTLAINAGGKNSVKQFIVQ